MGDASRYDGRGYEPPYLTPEELAVQEIDAAIAEAVAAARAEIVRWLRHQQQLHHRLAVEARDAGDHEAMSTHSSISHTCLSNAREIESGEPQRWAAERKGQGDG